MEGNLRVLFVTPYVPSSVRVRPFAFIRELARLGVRVTLVCLVQPAHEIKYLSEVSPYCEDVYPVFLNRFEPYLFTLASLPTSLPMSVAYCRSDHLEQLILYLAEKNSYDLIHTEFMRAVPSTFKLKGYPKVFDAVDSGELTYRRSLSASYVSPRKRLVALVEWLKVRRYESWALNYFDQILVSSPVDSLSLKRSGHQNVTVIPNGVDTNYFAFSEQERESKTLVFLGKMSYYVNVSSVLWFYREVFPLIKREHPDVKFKIVGRDPTRAVRNLIKDPAVEVTGTVADVRPYLSSGTVSVCPMVSGAGIQNKMLEAMAVGIPTVATSLACQALEASPEQDYLLGRSCQEFASAVIRLLEDPQLQKVMAFNGRQYVEQVHSWEKIGECLGEVYTSLLTRPSSIENIGSKENLGGNKRLRSSTATGN
jgi:polysaccharide biosynthesis protein PslH